jgi:hypothetical protein
VLAAPALSRTAAIPGSRALNIFRRNGTRDGVERGLQAARSIIEEDLTHAHERIDQLRGIAIAAGLAWPDRELTSFFRCERHTKPPRS